MKKNILLSLIELFYFPILLNIQGQSNAIPVSDFLNSIGVNSSISTRGETRDKTLECVKYMGIHWLRTGYEGNIPVDDLIYIYQQSGVKSCYGLLSGGNDINRLLTNARKLANAGALLAIEGNNEPNNWGPTYEGVQGGRDKSWIPVAKLQRDLYQTTKTDPILKDYPVFTITEGGAQTDNVGLQFLTIPSGANTLMPNGTQYADYANCHNYISHGSWPGIHDNQTWLSSEPLANCPVDGLYGNYGSTWGKKFQGYSDQELLTLPRVTTETGITIEGEVTEEMQARLYLNLYLSQFKRGWDYTAIYLLRDRSDEAGNQSFGFYKADYSPRKSAIYMHNFTTILKSGKENNFQTGTFNYFIPRQPETVHDLLLQKSDTTFALILWGEKYNNGKDDITVRFDKKMGSVKIYDPTLGTNFYKEEQNISSLNLTMTDHPIIIEVGGKNIQGGEIDPETYPSYYIDGDEELDAFLTEKTYGYEIVNNLTLKNISNRNLDQVQYCVSIIKGTTLWDNISSVQTTENFFNKILCQGSIIIKNCLNLTNPNGFKSYTTINGDFILENCPNLVTGFGEGWENDAFTHITKVSGNFRLINVGRISGLSIKVLKEVGGDFEISGCNTMFWDFKAGISLETVSGDFIINNNAVFENLKGLEGIRKIGGDISIVDNNSTLGAYTPDWEDGTFSNAKGFCLLATWKQNNVFSTDAKVTLRKKGDEQYIDIDKLVPCGDEHDDDYYLGISSTTADQALVITTINGCISISAPWESYNIEIYDMSGCQVYKTIAFERNYICNEINLQLGAYAVRVGGNKVSIGRLIIVK